MNSVDHLIQRVSVPGQRLVAPAPDDAQLELMFRAAMSAPDHGDLKPQRFIVVRGDAKQRLREVYEEAFVAAYPGSSAEDIAKQADKALRAPMMIFAVAHITEGKIPEWEQIVTAGVATEHLQLAANALGFGCVWVTGPFAKSPIVNQKLGLEANEKIVGIVYVGTVDGHHPQVNRPHPAPFVREWFGPCSDEPAI